MQDSDRSDSSEIVRFDDTRPGHWPEPFQSVEILSPMDGELQKAWYFPCSGGEKRPLLVSLHTWGGDYNQNDPLAPLAVKENWNYIHPDFRGPNRTAKACCSEFALDDIDQAIDFAIKQGNVDPDRIYVNGVSGGGYAALALYMRSRHHIRSISVWVPISDLAAWHKQSVIRRATNYADNIIQCTGSQDNVLDIEEAKARSPIFWDVPGRDTRLHIYAGVFDGIQGSVPITQSINFYNKLVADLGAVDEKSQVSVEEKAWLLEHRMPSVAMGEIGDRKICLQKQFKTIDLIIFEGNHEMLIDVAYHNILQDL